jgi:flagellar biosynthesis protein FlhA
MSATASSAPKSAVIPTMSLTSRLAGPILIAAVLLMLIVPLSPAAISFMFALNIAAGLTILAAAIYIPQPSEFLSFPSILLSTTLMRLALNVATARAILLRGDSGTGAAGRVIESFGEFVVGGDYVVGFIIFGILIIINFVVVTKGSSRVAEVSARFMLDSLPGRQMAIDADVNAGTLTAKQAEGRRELVRREADFFGAMDGASKFVRGDVIAAMIILAVNLVGGLLVGTLQHGLSLAVAAHNYTLLTVGDGVAAQIPSLAISIAAGLVVTKVATGEDIGTQIIAQMSRYPQALFAASALLIVLGLTPGMAHVPFLGFGLLTFGLGLRLQQTNRAQQRQTVQGQAQAETPAIGGEEQTLDQGVISRVDAFGLEIGFALVPLLSGGSASNKQTLLKRLTAIRLKYSRNAGFMLPNIHIRDSDAIKPNEYRFTIRGAVVGAGNIMPNSLMAIESKDVYGKLKVGRPTKDPVYGHPALWIAPEAVRDAESMGYTVVDASGVIGTHLTAVLEKHGWEMLGRSEVEDMLQHQAKRSPKLIEELRTRFQLGVVRQVLQYLLMENISVADLERIAEAIVDIPETAPKDPERILAVVRQRLGRRIVSPYVGADQAVRVLAIEPQLEALVQKAVSTGQDQGVGQIIEPNTAKLLRAAAVAGKARAEQLRATPVLAVRSGIRYAVARCLAGIMPVIAVEEIPETSGVIVIDTLKPPSSDAKP